tara:strand:+ start:557 stop:865 length:309 start_codon:yes stop_codon:yes gene_type:complete
MSIYQTIEKKIEKSLSPLVLRIENESYKHSVPRDAETHFKMIIVSACFEKKSLVKRHQLVYELLSHEMKNGLHALSLNTQSPQEWDASSEIADTPNCMGVAK